jgi:Peptidase M1 N-terminal domain/Peptidase family M1 domain
MNLSHIYKKDYMTSSNPNPVLSLRPLLVTVFSTSILNLTLLLPILPPFPGNFWEYLAPETYDIAVELEPDLFVVDIAQPGGIANPAFNGSTAITFNVSQSTSCLVLHANNLTFSEISVTTEGAEGPTPICSSIDECNNVVTRVVKEPILSTADIDLGAIDLTNAQVTLNAATKAKFSFVYTAMVGISPNATGLHRSAPVPTCIDEVCTAKSVLATQLERVGARRLFPCYDMPAAKAIFTTKVTAPIGSAPVILGNTDEASRTTSEDGKYVIVQFEPTPIMSTYLVAIVVGELKELQGVDAPAGSPYKIRGWAVPGKEQSMAEAVSIGYKALEHFTNEIDSVTQPIKNYDFVAIPGKGFAMENWGLIIFDEGRALYNASTSGAYGLVRVASVVCHEIAHQWFGNMATCASWNQLLVNEGLASEEEYDCMQYAIPELSADVLRYKVLTPGGDVRSPHEGPLSAALLLSSDSLLPPASPESDFELNELTVERMVYSKGASIYFMIRYALDSLMGPLGKFWRPTLNRLISLYQYKTMVYSDIFYAAVDLYGPEYSQRVGPGKEIEIMNWAGGLILKTEQLRPSRGDMAKERVAFNGPSLATWAYSPAYPLLDTRKPGLINPTDYLETLANIGTNQTRYCSYNFTPEEATAANLSQEQIDRISIACEGSAMFSNVIVMHNLTDCVTNQTANISTVAGPIDYGPVKADAWVLNQHAVRLWRTLYTDEQLNNLASEASQMVACPPSRDTTDVMSASDGLCCAAAGDMLETCGLLSDSLWFGLDGRYDVGQAMKMVEAVTRAPVASTGLGQYLLLSGAIESMQLMRSYVAENATCAAIMDAFESNLLKPYTQAILQTALEPFVADSINSTVGIDGSREALLARLAASPLLSYAAYVPPSAQDGEGSNSTTSGRRRLLQTVDENATAVPAPAPAANEEAAAAAPTPAPIAGDTGDTEAPAPAPVTDAPTPAPAPTATAPTPTPTPAPSGEYTNGDLELQSELCALLPSTPLWKNYINYGSNKPTATNTTTVPVDLLPAIYGIAAAMPPGCRTALEEMYATTTLAQTAASTAGDPNPFTEITDGIINALHECYYYDNLFTEAVRCVYALAGAGDPEILLGFAPAFNSPKFSNLYLVAERKGWMANMLRPYIVTNIAKQSSHAYVAVIDELQDGALWDLMGTSNACITLNLMAFVAVPANTAQADALERIIEGKGQDCPPNLIGRMKGKVKVARTNAARLQEQMCAYLDGWQARQEQGKRR